MKEIYYLTERIYHQPINVHLNREPKYAKNEKIKEKKTINGSTKSTLRNFRSTAKIKIKINIKVKDTTGNGKQEEA